MNMSDSMNINMKNKKTTNKFDNMKRYVKSRNPIEKENEKNKKKHGNPNGEEMNK